MEKQAKAKKCAYIVDMYFHFPSLREEAAADEAVVLMKAEWETFINDDWRLRNDVPYKSGKKIYTAQLQSREKSNFQKSFVKIKCVRRQACKKVHIASFSYSLIDNQSLIFIRIFFLLERKIDG